MAESVENPFSGTSSTRVLGITSGKGGVGKSSVTVNLAVALAQLGHNVAVLDADVYGFSIPDMFGIVDDPELTEDQKIIPPVAHGVKCVSIGFFVEEDKPVMWRGPMLHKALQQFLTDVEWGEPDFLLIDMPPGTGDVAMSMAGLLPAAEIFVVTTPQPAAQTIARRSGAMAREVGLAVGGVIENMSWFTGDDGKRYELFGSGGGEALAEQLRTTLLARLPLVPALRQGGDTGVPITIAESASEVAMQFQQLAKTIEQTGPRRVYRKELQIR
jgi:ATP-binding protein involved in chromosome partitioning